MALEEERKYEVTQSFVVPDLHGCLPDGGAVVAGDPVTLTATYYDTDDFRLARAGASLRYRRGDQRPWTVKLPTGTAGIRHEISRPGRPGTPPAELTDLVTATTRGAPIAPVARIRTRRRGYQLRDSAGRVLAELADDTVSVLDGQRIREKFREVEVERGDGDRALLDRVGAALVEAGGASPADQPRFQSKYARAVGEAAAGTPDLPPPQPLPARPLAGDVVTQAIRRSVTRIFAHDPLLRLRTNLPDGDTPVHQMRVGCRRLRSDLATFDPLVDPQWAKRLRRKLRWLARALGAARDAEVLRTRLHRTAADPLVPVDAKAVARIDAVLAARQAEALEAIEQAVGSQRYLALLDRLVEAAQRPRLTALAAASAQEVLPRLVAGPWREFAFGPRGVGGATDLTPDAPDEDWHQVRINGKRARYAIEAVAEVIGGAAPKLAKRLAAVQDLLGEHQDAAVAAETWLAAARSDPDDHALAIAAGRLYERERAAIRRVRKQFPAAWQAATDRKLTAWLP
ncbi:MAG TPA: CYTH and CHAD domain-containing protein [Natronosporangium sp.]